MNYHLIIPQIEDSVTDIKECGDYLIISTDRNGIWRSEKARYSLNEYFDFNISDFNIDDNPYYSSGIKSYGGKRHYWYDLKPTSESHWIFSHLIEKIYKYTITDSIIVSSLTSIVEKLIGGYFVFNNILTDEKNCFEILSADIDGSNIVLRLSAGKNKNYSYSRENPFTSLLDRWSSDQPINGENYTWTILDFAQYEKISTGLPIIPDWKNSSGEEECGVFINGIHIVESSKVLLACGIHGVYISENISAETPSWEQLIDSDYNITSVSSDGINEYYIGTWGNGVFKYNGSLIEMNTDINEQHMNIWTLYYSTENKLYAGTEHGGVYVYNFSSDIWGREGVSLTDDGGVVRSGIFSWSVVGIPVYKGDLSGNKILNYDRSGDLLAYAWGGGIFRKVSGSDIWEQYNVGLKNFYVQSVSVCGGDSTYTDSQAIVAYAATCGGGVFVNEDVFGDGIWEAITDIGLPSTLNIDKVVVGINKDIIHIHSRINDLSSEKTHPALHDYVLNGLVPTLPSGAEKDYLMGQRRFGFGGSFWYYTPLCPYTNGDRNHVIYRGTKNITWSWDKVFDLSEGLTTGMASIIYGLTCVPGSESDIRFIYKYNDSWGWGYFVFEAKSYAEYVSISSDKTIIRKPINISTYSKESMGEYGGLSIDIKNTNIAYLTSATPISYNSRHSNISVYRSEDDGISWTDITPRGSFLNSSFNSDIQILSKQNYIYGNFGNNIYVSNDKGDTWNKIQLNNNDIAFNDFSFNIISIVDIPNTNNLRLKFVLLLIDGEVNLYEQNESVWAKIDISSLNINQVNLIENNLQVIIDGAKKNLYITEKYRILKLVIDNNIVESQTIIFTSIFPIQYPLTISEYNTKQCFVCNNNLYVGESDNFTSISSFTDDVDCNDIKKIVIGTNSDISRKNDVFICIDSVKNTITNYNFGIASYNINGVSNSVTINNYENTFSAGDVVSFYNGTSKSQYNSVIGSVESSGSILHTLDSIVSVISGYSYNSLSDMTEINFNTNSSTIKDYVGTSICLCSDSDFTNYLYTGVLDSVVLVSNTIYKVLINGNISDQIALYSNVYIRIGCLSEIINLNVDSINIRKENISPSNGLWYYYIGSTLKPYRLGDVFHDDKYYQFGCNNVFVFENGAISASFTNGTETRVFINDNWIPSEQIISVVNDSNGDVICATSESLFKKNNLGYFDSYYMSDIINMFKISDSEYYIFTSNGLYAFSSMPNYSDKSTYPILINKSLTSVNAIIKDIRGIYWIATDNGIFGYSGNRKFEYASGRKIYNMVTDSYNRIWFCDGSNVVYLLTYGFNSNGEIIFNENEYYGITGSISSLIEKSGLRITSDGRTSAENPSGGTNPYVDITWSDSSKSGYSTFIILRGLSDTSVDLSNITISKSSISGVIDSVEAATITINGSVMSVWRIGQTNLSITDTDGWINSYIFTDVDSSDNSYQLYTISGDSYFYIKSTDTIPVVGKRFMVAQKIEDSYVLSVSTDDFYIDSSVKSGSYYYMFVRSNLKDNLILDVKQIVVSSTEEKIYDYSSEIYAASEDGLFKFNNISNNRFDFIKSWNCDISKMYIDSINRIWLCANSKLISYTSSYEYIYTKTNFSITDANFRFNDCVEDSNNGIYIATNMGLIIKDFILDKYSVYVENDLSNRVYFNSNGMIFNLWRESFSTEFVDVEFIPLNNDESPIYQFGGNYINQYALLLNNNILYQTDNFGANWDKLTTDSIDKMIPYYDPTNVTIIGYHIVSDDIFKYMLSSKSNKINTLIVDKQIDNVYGAYGIPSSLYVSESSTTFNLYSGIYNTEVKKNEIEIVKTSFIYTDCVNLQSNVEIINNLNGLSIQSVYCFYENSNKIYAGCKDNIIVKEIGSSWSIVPFDNNSKEVFRYSDSENVLDTHVFSDIVVYDNIIYATRTPLYWKNNDDNAQYILAIRNDGCTVNLSTKKYDLSSNMIDSSTNASIPQYEDNNHRGYSAQEINKNILTGHKGAICLSGNNLFVGGFDNSILYVPFISDDRSDESEWKDGNQIKENVVIVSGRRNKNNTGLPLTNDMQYIYSGTTSTSDIQTYSGNLPSFTYYRVI